MLSVILLIFHIFPLALALPVPTLIPTALFLLVSEDPAHFLLVLSRLVFNVCVQILTAPRDCLSKVFTLARTFVSPLALEVAVAERSLAGQSRSALQQARSHVLLHRLGAHLGQEHPHAQLPPGPPRVLAAALAVAARLASLSPTPPPGLHALRPRLRPHSRLSAGGSPLFPGQQPAAVAVVGRRPAAVVRLGLAVRARAGCGRVRRGGRGHRGLAAHSGFEGVVDADVDEAEDAARGQRWRRRGSPLALWRLLLLQVLEKLLFLRAHDARGARLMTFASTSTSVRPGTARRVGGRIGRRHDLHQTAAWRVSRDLGAGLVAGETRLPHQPGVVVTAHEEVRPGEQASKKSDVVNKRARSQTW